jgi:trypsin
VGRSRTITAIVLLGAGLTGAAPAWASGRAKSVRRIVGGTVAAPGQFPFMAFVAWLNSRGNIVFICSGSLVSSNVVLTAGHCTVNEKTGVPYRASRYRVVTGAVNWTKKPRTVSNVSKVRPDPNYDPKGPKNDAGLLVLSSPVKQPAVALWQSGPVNAGTAAQIVGWGETSANSGPTSNLHWGSTVVQGGSGCTYRGGGAFKFNPATMLCAQDKPSNHSATCNGDSGGPLLAKLNGVVTEVGLTSVGPANCGTHTPDYFTAVRPIYPWVSSQITANAP